MTFHNSKFFLESRQIIKEDYKRQALPFELNINTINLEKKKVKRSKNTKFIDKNLQLIRKHLYLVKNQKKPSKNISNLKNITDKVLYHNYYLSINNN